MESINDFLVKIILVCMPLMGYTQDYFNNLYTNGSVGFGKVTQYNSEFYLRGVGFNESSTRTIILSKYSGDGMLVQADTLEQDSIVLKNGVIEIENDKIYLFNAQNNTIEDGFPPEPENYNLQFSILDLDFNVEKTTVWGSNSEDLSKDILSTNDGFLLLAASTGFNNNVQSIYLTKINKQGEIQWEKTYGGATNHIPWFINYTHDGNFILSGNKEIESPNWNIYMVKITPEGEIIWEKDYGTTTTNYGGNLAPTVDNSFIVYRNVSDGVDINTTVGHIDKLDASGEIIWSKSFPYKNTLSAFTNSSPLANDDGTYTVVHTVRNNEEKIIARLLKLDPFGNTLWSKEFYTNPDRNNYVYDIQPTTDNGYIMAGSAYPFGDNTQHGWLVKTNCRGEEDKMYPVQPDLCDEYDCTAFSVDATFTADKTVIDLAVDSTVTFTNETTQTTTRIWDFGDSTKAYTSGEVTHTYTDTGFYEVELINFHTYCSDTAWLMVEVINTVGLSNHEKLAQQIKLFPNPNNGSFYVENNTKKTLSISITDALGKKVYSQNINTPQENISLNLPSGVYVVSFIQESNLVMKKIVVQ